MGDWIAPYDHNVVRRACAPPGFVVVGSTTLPEWGILPWTNTRRFGATRNPWDPDANVRRVLGRVGGRGRGRDGPDRPRQRRRRLDADPGRLLRPRRPQAAAQPHLAEPRDRAELPRDRRRADADGRRHRRGARRSRGARGRRRGVGAAAGRAVRRLRGRGRPSRLRVAVTVSPPLDVPVEAERAQAARDAGALLESLGHDVEEADPPWRRPQLGELFTALFAPARDAPGRPGADDRGARAGRGRHGAAELGAVAARRADVRARRAPRAGAARDLRPRPARLDGRLRRRSSRPRCPRRRCASTRSTGGRTTRWACSPARPRSRRSRRPRTSPGSPRSRCRCAEHEGLPVGVQLFGRPAREGALLAVAAQLEAALPWAGRRPPAP